MTDPIASLIARARLGRERQGAQEDSCVVFGAALLKVLLEFGVDAHPVTACAASFYHAVVRVGANYYDSKGLFNDRRVTVYKDDNYIHDYDEEDFPGLFDFFCTALRKSARECLTQQPTAVPCTRRITKDANYGNDQKRTSRFRRPQAAK